jgi:hypothetical protein
MTQSTGSVSFRADGTGQVDASLRLTGDSCILCCENYYQPRAPHRGRRAVKPRKRQVSATSCNRLRRHRRGDRAGASHGAPCGPDDLLPVTAQAESPART